MKTTENIVNEFYERERLLKSDILKELQKQLGNKVFNLEDLELEFEDESHNTIIKVDKETIYTDGEFNYSIFDLSILDALYILSNLQ